MEQRLEPYPESQSPALTTTTEPYLLVECRLAAEGVRERAICAFPDQDRANSYLQVLKSWHYCLLDFYVTENTVKTRRVLGLK